MPAPGCWRVSWSASTVNTVLLYRQSEIYSRQGVELSRKTMIRWVSEMADRLSTLYIALNSYVLEVGKVHT